MNEFQKRVMRSQYKENCYILMSPALKDNDMPKDIYNMNYNVSFLYDNPETGYASEWEPRYGPIQVWHKSESGREHYFFDYTDSEGGNWSQMSVEYEGLDIAFYYSEWDRIFDTLKRWTYR